jgi:NAD(P)-dependent dehydrogenase (short-subunit alcohol dehydrogenase family)
MKALVIGAAGHLGKACVEELLASGSEVYAADLSKPSVAGAQAIELDVTNLASMKSQISEIEKSGPIEALIYAAGVNFTGYVDQTDWQQYQKLMQVNLQGAFHVGAALQESMRSTRRDFSSVFISSTAGLKGEAGGSIYVATKFGLIGFVQSFASEIAQFGGRANAVCPGNVDSPMLRKLAGQIAARQSKTEEQVLGELAGSSAFNRLIDPREVARTCAWLLSSNSSGISGQTIVVDGPVA